MNSPARRERLSSTRQPARAALALAGLALFLSGTPSPAANSVGLSTVRSRGIDNFPLNGNPAKSGDYFGYAFATGDFNNDGVDDLATGIPFDDGVADIEQDIGAVYVQLGTAGVGLAPSGPFFLLSQEAGPDLSSDNEHFGWALASGDFNNDSYDDLAVGVPGNRVFGVVKGGVQVYFGSANPGVFDGGVVLAIPGSVGDSIGLALAAGDFDGDGYDDLAVGIPLQQEARGAVHVIYGTQGGLEDGSQVLQQDDPDIEDVGENNDRFGFALSAGDFNADGRDDLAVGVPNENGSGAVHVFFGIASPGLDLLNDLFWTQNTIAGNSETDDKFGFALAAGDFDGDGRSDLAIGSPGEALGFSNEITNTGMVAVVFGSSTGIFFDLGRTQAWTQGPPFALDTAEVGDRFSEAFAVGDFDHDGRDDLMIAHPQEDLLAQNNGAVTVLLGGVTGFSVDRSRLFSADSEGLPGTLQLDGYFGWAATSGDFDGDGFADLVIGEPFSSLPGGPSYSGMQIVLYGASFADGFDGGNDALWSGSMP